MTKISLCQQAIPCFVHKKIINSTSPNLSLLCFESILIHIVSVGKIVICDGGTISGVQTGLVIKHFEGVGMILTNIVANEDLVMMDCQLLLTIDVEETEAKEMKRYALARRKNTAKLAFLVRD